MSKAAEKKAAEKKAAEKKAAEKKVAEKKAAAKKAAAKKVPTKKVSTRISKSGKFKTIRHLVESVFKKKPGISYDSMEKFIMKEYPSSAFNKSHFTWYKAKIIRNDEWNYF